LEAKLLKNNTLLFTYQQSLLNWYYEHKRDLPWRQTPKFYQVWISEIVLQQTQVKQGLNYYLRFIEAFPNVESLANAQEDEVLKMWEGLGYYSRARNLHFAAKQIAELGEFPNNYKGWLKIKGVGPYTAAAISSIVAKEPRAVVDGNVQRVLSRLLNYNTPVNNTVGIKEVQAFAEQLLFKNEPGDYNQGLMELGAKICKPKNPNCIECPVQELCLANEKGTTLDLPVKEKKIKVRQRFLNFYLITKNDKILLERRREGDVWEGLYQFPLIETSSDKDLPNPIKMGFFTRPDLDSLQLLSKGNHLLSHQKLNISCWHLNINTDKLLIDNCKWYAIKELDSLALPRPLRKIISEYLVIED
jgi:A/G-specific adenine glycosylase